MAKYNPPPNWPAQPEGWTPPAGWEPDLAWGEAPEGWKLWLEEDLPTSAYGQAPGAPDQPVVPPEAERDG
jgi:hypothetical protein